MPRLTEEQLEKIKKKYNTDRIWSYSRISCFMNCQLEYKLAYIDKMPRCEQGAYAWLGSLSHETKQDWLEGKIEYDDMIMKFIEQTEWYKAGDHSIGKFPGYRGATSEDNRDKLFSALEHYFINTVPMEYKDINIEPAVIAKIGTEILIGYVDELILTKDNKIIILDDKTSSANGFSGKALQKKAAQLFLYMIALMQMKKLKPDQIIIMYDMMRYTNVCFMQKNGKEKKMRAERQKWVDKISKRLSTELVKEFGYNEPDAVVLIDRAIQENSLDCMPTGIKDRYWLENCYIEVPTDEDTIREYYKEYMDAIAEIREFETNVPKKIRGPIEPDEEFYCFNLCDQRANCPWHEKLKEDRRQEDLFAEVDSEDGLAALIDDPFNISGPVEEVAPVEGPTEMEDFFAQF